MQVIIVDDKNNKKYYTILTEKKYCKILVEDILYLTKENKYILFHCKDEILYKERNSLENSYKCLPQEQFVFIDRGIIVNMKHIIKFEGFEITMENGDILPVSRRKKTAVKDKLADYLRRT